MNSVSVESGENREWTADNKKKLISILENDGLDGDFQNLSKKVDKRSPDSFRFLVIKLENKREILNWVSSLNSKIEPLRAKEESLFAGNFPLVLELQSFFGQHPDPCKISNIDYSAV